MDGNIQSAETTNGAVMPITGDPSVPSASVAEQSGGAFNGLVGSAQAVDTVKQDGDFEVISPSAEEEVAMSMLFGNNSGLIDLINNYEDYARREYGDETYEEMEANDTEVSKCFNLLKQSVVSDNYALAPAVSLQDNPEYNDAKQIRDFLKRSLDNAGDNGTPFITFCEQLLDAIMYGHKNGEITWEFAKEGEDAEKDRLLIKYLKVKTQKSIIIVLDEFRNIVGYKPVYKTKTDNPNGLNESDDKENIGSPQTNNDKIYDPEKFITFTLRQRDDDPRGHSSFRAAVMASKSKRRLNPEFIRYLFQCAIPGLVFIAPEADDNNRTQYVTKDGELEKGANGKPRKLTAVQKILQEGLKFRNASVMALGHGGDVKQIEMKGEGGAFRLAREMFNEDIEMSILFNILATSQGKYQARSASQTHMEVQEIVIAYLREKLIQKIKDKVFKPQIIKNFGKKFLHLMPELSFGDTERRNFAIDGKTVASLVISKFFHPSQFPFLDTMLGVPMRDLQKWADYVAKQEELMFNPNKNGQNTNQNSNGKSKRKKKATALAAPNTNEDRAKQDANSKPDSKKSPSKTLVTADS